MRSSAECIRSPRHPADSAPAEPNRAPVEPPVCVFRHAALLNLPKPCRAPLRHFGDLLFDWSIETFGIADEEPDGEAIAARRLEALGEDLETVGHQLEALSREPEAAEAGPRERQMCAQAGHLAPAVLHLAARLRQGAEPRETDGER